MIKKTSMCYGGKEDQGSMIIRSAGTEEEYFESRHYIVLVFYSHFITWQNE